MLPAIGRAVVTHSEITNYYESTADLQSLITTYVRG